MIFFGERLSRQTASRLLIPLESDNSPPTITLVDMAIAFVFFNLKHNVAVIQKESIAGIDIVDKSRVTCADAFLGPGLFTQGGIDVALPFRN